MVNIIVISLLTGCLVDVVAVMGDVFLLVYNIHVKLALKVGNMMQTPKIKPG
jgi:hypothetical protein